MRVVLSRIRWPMKLSKRGISWDGVWVMFSVVWEKVLPSFSWMSIIQSSVLMLTSRMRSYIRSSYIRNLEEVPTFNHF